MTAGWSLPALLAGFHDQIEGQLRMARGTLAHPTDKGDASEQVWIDILNEYLPRRYIATKGHVVDSTGAFSDQIDVIIHDRQYSPLVFRLKESVVVPAESVYAVFEAKQTVDADKIDYAMRKAAAVRRLHRTTVPITTVDGERAAKPLHHIVGGILALASTWSPPVGQSLRQRLEQDVPEGRLDLGCVADAGWFALHPSGEFELRAEDKAATRFLFELIARLQAIGTVPMLDIRAYAAMI